MKGAELSTERVGVSPEAFAIGMYALASNARATLSKDDIAVFYERLADLMTEREWAALVPHVLDTHRHNGGWACIADLRAYLEEMRQAARAEGPSENELAAAELAADLEASR